MLEAQQRLNKCQVLVLYVFFFKNRLMRGSCNIMEKTTDPV